MEGIIEIIKTPWLLMFYMLGLSAYIPPILSGYYLILALVFAKTAWPSLKITAVCFAASATWLVWSLPLVWLVFYTGDMRNGETWALTVVGVFTASVLLFVFSALWEFVRYLRKKI